MKGASGQAIQNMNLVHGLAGDHGAGAGGAVSLIRLVQCRALPETRAMFEVSNQPPPLEPYNLFASDSVLREAVKRERPAGRRTG